MRNGKFVVLEGGDCSGKTTFFRFLREKYGTDLVFTNEPGGHSYGMKIRRLLLDEEGAEDSHNLTKFHLYWASKTENFHKVILPALKGGRTVVSDRFEGSTYAYQISEDPKLARLFWRTRQTCLNGVEPVYMYFDVDVATQIARAKDRIGERNYFDTRGLEYRKQIDAAYRKFFSSSKIKSYKVDASLPKNEMIALAHGIFLEITGF